MCLWNKGNNFLKSLPEEYCIKITAQRNGLAMSEKIPDFTVPLNAHHEVGGYTFSWCSSLLGSSLLIWFFPEEYELEKKKTKQTTKPHLFRKSSL